MPKVKSKITTPTSENTKKYIVSFVSEFRDELGVERQTYLSDHIMAESLHKAFIEAVNIVHEINTGNDIMFRILEVTHAPEEAN